MTEPEFRFEAEGDPDPEHWPMLVYFDAEHLSVPAEVCWTCSEEKSGTWIPVTQCDESRRLMEWMVEAGSNFHPATTTVLRGRESR